MQKLTSFTFSWLYVTDHHTFLPILFADIQVGLRLSNLHLFTCDFKRQTLIDKKNSAKYKILNTCKRKIVHYARECGIGTIQICIDNLNYTKFKSNNELTDGGTIKRKSNQDMQVNTHS